MAVEEDCKQPNGQHEDDMTWTEEGCCSTCLRFLKKFFFCASIKQSKIIKSTHLNNKVEKDVVFSNTLIASGSLIKAVVSLYVNV